MITILLGNIDRAGADDAQRPRGHEVRRVVPGAVPRELRRPRRERPGDAARDRRVRLVRHPDVDRRAGARHAADAPRGRRGPACPAASGSRSPPSGWCRSAIILRGLEGIKQLESWSAPLLLGGGVAAARLGDRARRRARPHPRRVVAAAAGAARRSGSCSRRRSRPTSATGRRSASTSPTSRATRAASARRCSARRSGLPTTMTAFAFIGVAVTSATIVVFGEAIWDPVVLIARIGSPPVDHRRRARRPARAAHDQHGGQRRLAGQRLLEPRAASASAT